MISSEAAVSGVSLLHGNALTFAIEFEDVFKEIYVFWKNFNVAKDNMSNVSSELRKVLSDVKQRNENLSGREDKSPCSKVKNIENIMLQKLEHTISQLPNTKLNL